MPDIPHTTEILDWNDDVVTVKMSGVQSGAVRKRAQLYGRRSFDPDVTVIDIMKAEHSEGIVKAHIVTFKRED